MTTLDSNKNRSFLRIEGLLIAIESLDKPNLKALIARTSIPPRTIQCSIKRLEAEFDVVIERVNGRRFGYYKIADWGKLNKERICRPGEQTKEPGLSDEV